MIAILVQCPEARTQNYFPLWPWEFSFSLFVAKKNFLVFPIFVSLAKRSFLFSFIVNPFSPVQEPMSRVTSLKQISNYDQNSLVDTFKCQKWFSKMSLFKGKTSQTVNWYIQLSLLHSTPNQMFSKISSKSTFSRVASSRMWFWSNWTVFDQNPGRLLGYIPSDSKNSFSKIINFPHTRCPNWGPHFMCL